MSETEAAAIEPAVRPPARDRLREFRESSFYASLRSNAQRRPWLWPYGGLGVLIAVVMWPAWFSFSRLVIGGDTLLNYYPWFELWRDELGAGRFPFWNPYTFGGMPAFATPHAGYAYPLNWLATPLPAIVAVNWLIGLHVLLAGLSAAWCAGRLGASKDGQFLSGAAFALGSVMVSRLSAGHMQHLEAIAWLPLATGFAVEAHKTYRPVFIAAAVAMIATSGQLEVLIFAGWWLPLWGLGAALGRPRRDVVTATLRVVLGVILGVGLAAFFILPFLAFNEMSNRSVITDNFRLIGSVPFWHLLQVFNPNIFGGQSDYWAGEGFEWSERLLYVGPVALFVAFWARGNRAWLCLAAVLIAVALALGSHAFWNDWTAHVPIYSQFRVPGKHLELAALGLCLAAGLGLDRINQRAGVVAAGVAALLLIAGIGAKLWLPSFIDVLGGLHINPEAKPDPGDLNTLVESATTPLVVAALSLAAIALLSLLPRTWFRRGILVVAVLELIFVLGPDRFHPEDPAAFAQRSEAISSYKRAVFIDDGAIDADFGPITKVIQPGGYNAIFGGEYQRLLVGARNSGVVINIYSGSEQLAYLLGYPVMVKRETKSVTVFDPPPPEAWVAKCSWPGGAQEVREPGFPMLSCVTRADATSKETPVDRVAAQVVSQTPGHVRIDAEGPGWLTTVQPWYPGWTAKLDGKRLDVEVLDGALVGAELPAGQHTVEFSYLPAGFKEGLALTGLTILVIGGILFLERRRVTGRE